MSIAPTTKYITVNAGTGNVTINAASLFSRYVIETNGYITLSANLVFNISGTPFEGQTIYFDLPGTINTGGYSFSIFGLSIPSYLANKRVRLYFRWNGGAGVWYSLVQVGLLQAQIIDGVALLNHSIPLNKLSGAGVNEIIYVDNTGTIGFLPVNAQRIIVNNGTTIISAQQSSASQIDWLAVSDQLTFLIKNEVITDAHISLLAAISRNKLSNGTPNHVLINDGSGVMSSEAQLSVSRGGTGLNNSAATGVQKYTVGVPSVDLIGAADVSGNALPPSKLTQQARTEMIHIPVSFESGEQCDNKIRMGYNGTVVEVYACVVKGLSGTDDGTITMKNNAGTNMTGGTITLAASSALNTAQTVTPTANNTFVEGDVLSAVTNKPTAGGKVLLSIKVERSD